MTQANTMNRRSLLANASLKDAILLIEETRLALAPVTDGDGKLLGTVTDGDIRRCILNGGDLDTPLSTAMNRTPLTASLDTAAEEIAILLKSGDLEAVPLIRADGRFSHLMHLRDLTPKDYSRTHERAAVSAAVIMAGGEGRRLRPLTEQTPKPMIEIGGTSVLHRHVRNLDRAGVARIFISLNYMADTIETHLSSLTTEATVEFIREPIKLGTAGALSLLPALPQGPILVLNSDVVHTADYANLTRFHRELGGDMTVAAIEHNIQVPFGVIRTKEGLLFDLEEKPSERFLCNAGIYLLNQDVLNFIPRDRAIDMTEVMLALRDAGRQVNVFPLHEYWADIGSLEDLERVRSEIGKVDG